MFLLPLVGCLLLSLSAESRGRLADHSFFKVPPILALVTLLVLSIGCFSYIPAYPLQRNGSAMYHPHVLTPHFKIVKSTKFHVSWNPIRCTEGRDERDYHTIVLSFLIDWVPRGNLTEAQLQNNALVVKFTGRSVKKAAAPSLSHYYNVKTFKSGKATNTSFDLEVTPNNEGFYVRISQGMMEMGVYRNGNYEHFSLSARAKIPKKTKLVALLANQQYECPVFISAVDSRFPIWLPGRGVPSYAKGLRKEQPGPPMLVTGFLLSLSVMGVITFLAASGFFMQWRRKLVAKKKTWMYWEAILNAPTPTITASHQSSGTDLQKDSRASNGPQEESKMSRGPEEESKVLKRPQEDDKLPTTPQKDSKLSKRPQKEKKLSKRPHKKNKLSKRPQKDSKLSKRPHKNDSKISKRPQKESNLSKRPNKESKLSKPSS